ncbi:MAG: branched-chain amino acid ABC transporter permease [Deltaproteobacteria bacterium]|nr:branched-chain amino acid ABC transporter permease [Deltaproteobacteria bacterium]
MTPLTISKKSNPETEMSGMNQLGLKTKFPVVAGLVLLLALVPLLHLSLGGFGYWLHMLLYTFMYIAMASAWNIIGGFAGYISLGHNVFFAVGGYFSAVLLVYFDISPFLTTPLAGLAAMVLGIVFGLISLRTRGPAFIISTIALTMVIKIAFDNWDYIGGSNGISLPLSSLSNEVVKIPFYFAFYAIALVTVYSSYRIRHSKFGLGLRAIAQDEMKAELAGIQTRQYKIMAFGLSGFFVGMTGAIWGDYLTFLRPTIFLSILVAAKLVLMTVLGGKGTVSGPVLGAILFILINEFFVTVLGGSELNIVATGLLLAVVLLFFPKGIVGTLKDKGLLPQFLDWG